MVDRSNDVPDQVLSSSLEKGEKLVELPHGRSWVGRGVMPSAGEREKRVEVERTGEIVCEVIS